MNIYFKTATTSLFLATLLLSGCGSSTTSKANNTDNNTKVEIELSKQETLKKELRSDGVEYKTSTYSQDKSEILLAGIKDGKTTIYKFDASTLELIEKFSFEIDGLLDIKSENDGKYTITAQDESGADNFVFDSVSGDLVKSSDDNQDLTDIQIAENFINSAKNRATELDIKNFHWDKDEGWDKMELKTVLTENLYVAQLTRDVDKGYGLYDYDFVIFDTKKMQIMQVLSRQRVGMLEYPNLELKGYATNFSVDKDSNTLTYNMSGASEKQVFNYKTNTLYKQNNQIKPTDEYNDFVVDTLLGSGFTFPNDKTNLTVVDTESKLIVTGKLYPKNKNKLYEVLISIDKSTGKIDEISKGVDYFTYEYKIYDIDKSEHILTYKKSTHGFIDSASIVKYDYVNHKVIDSVYKSTGPGI